MKDNRICNGDEVTAGMFIYFPDVFLLRLKNDALCNQKSVKIMI